MSLVARLVEFVADIVGAPEAAEEELDPRLAAAALLVHVARIDGRWTQAERERLLDMMGRRFGLSPEAAGRFLERADRADHEADDISTLIDGMGHDFSADERRNLVAMAYAVAGADGETHEFEENLVWRIGRLLGLEDAEIHGLRPDAAAPAGLGP